MSGSVDTDAVDATAIDGSSPAIGVLTGASGVSDQFTVPPEPELFTVKPETDVFTVKPGRVLR